MIYFVAILATNILDIMWYILATNESCLLGHTIITDLKWLQKYSYDFFVTFRGYYHKI